ncbi:MAG: hypothetical protein ACK5U7_03555 [Bacteroidota bacterium]
MLRFITWFQQRARPRIIGMVTLAYLLCALGIMQPGVKKLEKLSGKPVDILDLQLGFSVEKAQSILSGYSAAALQEAATFLVWADTLYPLIYGLLLSLLLAVFFRKGRIQFVVMVPVLAVLVDFAENYWLYKVLNGYPKEEVSWIEYASACNTVKWSLLGISGVFLLFGSLQRLLRFLPSMREVAP